ncbi:transposase [Terriglobus saanensis]|uniref:transposase n=1 Tax=Terriglobus saanensis TaxID=870903 RepID=UPI0001E520B4|nr:transposase [Terriglobus saanensis]
MNKRVKPIVHASPRHTAWLILKETASAKPYLDELYRASPEIAQLAHLGKEFFRIVRCRDLAVWPKWLEDAQHTALSRFVSGITRDRDAVEAALHLPWSNTPGRGTGPSAQAAQTADVRTRQLRSAKTARPPEGLKTELYANIDPAGTSFTKCTEEPK